MSPTSPVSPAAYTYNAGLPVYAPPSPGLPPNPYRSSREDRESAGGADKFSFLPQKYSQKLSSLTSGSGRHEDDLAYGKPPPEVVKTKNTADLAYGKGPSASAGPASPATYGSYISGGRPVSPADGERRSGRSRGDSFLDPRMSGPTVLTVDGPGSRDRSRSRDGRKRADTLQVDSSSSHRERSRSRDGRRDKSPSRNSLQVDSARRDRSRSRDGRRDTSPQPRMTNLLVDTGKGAGLTLVASPLLESYRGTYQDCSPMPSPLLLASQPSDSHHRIVEPLSPIGSDSEGKRERRARFHDAEDITTRLATALKGSRAPDTGPLIDILPSLTHEQVLELRSEYKRIVKTGSERKGVNISKHIKARLKDEEPLLMKLCYTVALGRWESEAYWANSWYHGDKNRRELLIESLMGRTNAEIAAIKDAFTDKKYDDSLTKCMKTELKEDKFKKAVLMVLDMRRMDEYDQYGRRIPVDLRLVDQDVEDLRRAVTAEKGGESAMISIVVQRSESHLREILKEYERQYRVNFAREALRKSGNLVVSCTHTHSLSLSHTQKKNIKKHHDTFSLTSLSSRVNSSHTFSTASSTVPYVTLSYCTTP